MGEKEQGTARESSAPSISERDAGSGMSGQATGRESAIGEDDWEAPVSLATGGTDGDGTPEDARGKVVTHTSSNIQNNREGVPDGSGGLDDDGDGMPEAAVESHGIVVKRPDGGSG